jgi:anti-sigma factor RsiW
MTRQDCRPFESLLVRAADGGLNDADRTRLEAHVAGCDACRESLADQIAVRQALQARPALGAGPDFSVRVMTAIEAQDSRFGWLDWLDFRQWTWRLAPVAGALLVAAAAVTQLAPAPSDATSTAAATDAPFDASLPVSAALWQDSLTDTSVLSLMLSASADDRLTDAYKER